MGGKRALPLIGAVLMLASPVMAQTLENPGLAADLRIETPEVHAQGPLLAHFTLTNTSGRELAVLKWHTPLEGFRSDMFQVKRDGAPVRYLGALVKRGAPAQEEVLVLPKGGSVSAAVDLFKAYAIFDPGEYTVQFAATLYVVRDGTSLQSQADSGLVSVEVSSRPVPFRLLEPRTPSPATVKALSTRPPSEPSFRLESMSSLAFENCTAEQVDALEEARRQAALLAAYSSISIWLTPVSKRPSVPYQTWFGAYDAARYDQVANNFTSIYNALANEETLKIHCADKSEDNCYPLSNTFAFVYPGSAYDVYVCPLYWKVPPLGMDSQTDTLVHEVSHFYVVANTSDYRYGASSCKDLALTDPAKAIANADSYAYFSDTFTPTP
jgi:peptidyl-Lys metalloendopeptidase